MYVVRTNTYFEFTCRRHTYVYLEPTYMSPTEQRHQTHICMYVCMYSYTDTDWRNVNGHVKVSQSVPCTYICLSQSAPSAVGPLLPARLSWAHETKSCMQSLTQHFTQNTCIMRNKIQLFRFSAFPFFLRTAYNTIPLHRAPPWSPLSSPHRKSKVQGTYDLHASECFGASAWDMYLRRSM